MEDARLLVEAHEQLLSDQASGVSVLGSTAGGELLAVARRLTDVVVDSAERAFTGRRDELQVRRERRAAAQSLRTLPTRLASLGEGAA